MNRPAIYNRPQGKSFVIPVKKRSLHGAAPDATERAQPVVVDKATECHVTPCDVARRMVDYLGPQGDYSTLEPSAGTGQLARALLDSGHSRCELTLIERHISLANKLHAIGPTLNKCFLEYAAEARGQVHFPRVLMNPPFRKARQHVAAALSLMGSNGHTARPVLVSIVPSTFEHPNAETLEHLPDDTFALARVNTKIVRIYA